MYILALIVEIFVIRLAIKLVLQTFKPKRKSKLNRIHSEKPIPKQTEINLEKAIRQQEKANQQAEKARQKKEQAHADIEFYQMQLDKTIEMLSAADNELNELEKQIQIDRLMRSYDKASKREKQKTQVENRIISLENKVHAIETKLAKAYYITQAV